MQGDDPGLGVLFQIFQDFHEPHVGGVTEIHGLAQRAGEGLGPHLGSAALGHQRDRRRIGRADEIHKSGGKTIEGVQHPHGVGADDMGLVLSGGSYQFVLQFFPLDVGVGKTLGNDHQPADALGKTFLGHRQDQVPADGNNRQFRDFGQVLDPGVNFLAQDFLGLGMDHINRALIAIAPEHFQAVISADAGLAGDAHQHDGAGVKQFPHSDSPLCFDQVAKLRLSVISLVPKYHLETSSSNRSSTHRRRLDGCDR